MKSLALLATLAFSSIAVGAHAGAADGFVPEDLQAKIDFSEAGLRQCMVDHAVKLGARNSESADTILRAVKVACAEPANDLSKLYLLTGYSLNADIRFVNHAIATDGDYAVSALLAARANLPAKRVAAH